MKQATFADNGPTKRIVKVREHERKLKTKESQRARAEEYLRPFVDILKRQAKGDLHARGTDIVRCHANEHVWQAAEQWLLENPRDEPPKPRKKKRVLKSSGHNLQAVSLALRNRGDEGATDEELEQITGLGPNSARPRRIDLVRMKRVADSGRKRKTQRGFPASVWVWTGAKL